MNITYCYWNWGLYNIMVNQFIESIKRLYGEGKIKEEKIIEWCNDGKITIEDKLYILEVH